MFHRVVSHWGLWCSFRCEHRVSALPDRVSLCQSP